MNRYKYLLYYLIPILAGILLLPIPLLRDFHFESAMIAATVGAYWAGFSLLKGSYSKDKAKILGIFIFLYLFGLPLFINAFFAGCLTVQGVLFWILTPIPSVFLGAAIGRLVRAGSFRHSKTILLSILLFCSAGILLLEFKLFPQVYFFNHIWGTWPGPIYDESVSVTRSYLVFRGMTFLWIFSLWSIPRIRHQKLNRLVLFICGMGLIASYFNLAELGIITPRSFLKKQLSTLVQTEHFDLYFNPSSFSSDEIEYWTLKHEFFFHQITEALEIDWPEDRRIESYLYGNAWQKKDLVGAKFTSYVPIWLAQDQMHIAQQHLSGVLKHELVHVISKQFGNSLFNGSWSIGLIEGVAEAVANDASSESTLAQIIAAVPPYPTVKQMRNSLTISGFYSSAASISYTTTGAFVQYLLNHYPVQNFKDAYAKTSFDKAYSQLFDSLVIQWERTLSSVAIDSVDKQVSEFLFGQLSLFQKTCPHSLSRELVLWDTFNFQQTTKDTTAALKTIETLFNLDPGNSFIKRDWARAQLHEGDYESVIQTISETDTLLTLQLLKADALTLNNNFAAGTELLQSLKPRLDESTARTFRYSFDLRADSTNWTNFLATRYQNLLPDSATFALLPTPNQMHTISKAIELQRYSKLPEYSSIALSIPINADWFDVYEELIDKLISLHLFDEAERWIKKVSEIELRARYQERLTQQEEWLLFMKIN
ncbi:MAG: hypothetical protein WC967_06475 [Balneolaceae bacterium]